jgi:hypothetical protein
MDYDRDRVDDMVLALLYLTMHEDRTGTRVWKGHDWATMGRLHEKGYIANPKVLAKSVAITEEGKEKAEQLFLRLFGKTP